MLINGSNLPIIIHIRNPIVINNLSAVLANYKGILKIWDLDNAVLQDGDIILPISEQESLSFESGKAVLEIKILDDDNNVICAKPQQLYIENRIDDTVIGG